MIVYQMFRTIPDSFLDLDLEVRKPWERVKKLECKDGVGCGLPGCSVESPRTI